MALLLQQADCVVTVTFLNHDMAHLHGPLQKDACPEVITVYILSLGELRRGRKKLKLTWNECDNTIVVCRCLKGVL